MSTLPGGKAQQKAEPPPFVQPPPVAGTWEEKYIAHVNFFRNHFAKQLDTKYPTSSRTTEESEEFVRACLELYSTEHVVSHETEPSQK